MEEMIGMQDWNELTLKESVEHLRQEYQFSSSGNAKCIFNLIRFYDESIDQNKE